MKYIIRHITRLLAVALLAVGCTTDDAPERNGSPTAESNGRLLISLALPEDVKTRALTAEWANEGESEREVKNYYLLITEKTTVGETTTTNILEAISGSITWGGHDDANKYHTSPAITTTNDISAGNHQLVIYCLANFSNEMIGQAGLTLTGGNITDTTLPDGFETKAITIANSATMPTGGIPMTGKLQADVYINGDTEITDPLILWRAMAKVEFQFYSKATTDVKVTGIKLWRVTSGPIHLISQQNLEMAPNSVISDRSNYASNNRPSFPQGSNNQQSGSGQQGNDGQQYGSGQQDGSGQQGSTTGGQTTTDFVVTLAGDGLSIAKNTEAVNAISASLYINESLADAASQRLAFTLTTVRQQPDGTLKTTDENFLLTDLAFVLRNDHVIIPVCFTDYIFKPQFFYFDPIGGQHDQIEEVEGAFYYRVTKSDADFAIVPELYNAVTNQRIPLAETSGGTGTDIVNWSYDNGDGKGTAPTIFSNTGAPAYLNDGMQFIKGTFNNTAGTAVFTFSYKNSTSGITLSRQVTIEVKN